MSPKEMYILLEVNSKKESWKKKIKAYPAGVFNKWLLGIHNDITGNYAYIEYILS